MRQEKDISMQPKNLTTLLLILVLAAGACLLLWGGPLATLNPARAAGQDQPDVATGDPCQLVACLQITPAAPAPVAHAITARPINEQIYVVDLARMGVHPL